MRNYNLDDFRKWINEQEEDKSISGNYNKGDFVKSKVPFKKLINRVNEENGNRKSICKEFYTNGGTIISSDKNNLIVEVKAGTFSINKIYIELD